MHVAVLGLGKMGQGIASRLLDRGYDVSVWNRSPGKARDLVDRGAHEAKSIAEAVRAAEVIVTMLTDDRAVQEVYLGEGGILSSLSRDEILVDMSTVSPDTSRALADAAREGRFITAPIMGSPSATAAGQARLLLGGNEETVERLRSLWEDLSAGFTYCGENSKASTMKLLSNQILIGATTLMAEAVATAEASGIGHDTLRQFLSQSPVIGPTVRLRLDDVLDGDHEPLFTVRLADKDLRLALQLAEKAGIELPTTSAAERALEQADEAGYGEKDMAAVVEVVRPH